MDTSEQASPPKRSTKQQQPAKQESKYVYVEAKKRYMIFRAPAVLTVHLKRFQKKEGSYYLQKDNRHVDFPLELDLAPFMCKHGEVVGGCSITSTTSCSRWPRAARRRPAACSIA